MIGATPPGMFTLNSWLPLPTLLNPLRDSKVPLLRIVTPPAVTDIPLVPEIKLSARTLALSLPDFPQPCSNSAERQPTTNRKRDKDMGSPDSSRAWEALLGVRSAGPLLEDCNRRQRFPLEKLEECAACCRDVRDPVGDAEFVDSGDGVAASGDRKRVRCSDRFGEGARPGGKSV